VFLQLDLVKYRGLVDLVVRKVLQASEIRLVALKLLVTLHLHVVLLMLFDAQLLYSLL
jgi:hypothetical protein